MATCVPVRDMRDTAAFTQLVASEQEVTVTKNGYEAIHCLSPERYRVLCEAEAKARLLSRMALADAEKQDGKYSDYAEFSSQMKEKYGLQ